MARKTAGMTLESDQLKRILTLNQVGIKIQEPLKVEDIYHLIGEGLKEIGLNCTLMLLDEEGKNLKSEYVSLMPSMINEIEKLLGKNAESLNLFSLDSETSAATAVKEKRAIFTDRPLDMLLKYRSSLSGPLIKQIAKTIGVGHAIVAPLVARGQAFGVINVFSHDLTEEEVPIVIAFANQAAIAIDNAVRLPMEFEAMAKELRESEEKYRQLLEDINDGYVVIQDGKCVYINRRFGEIFGYEPEKLIGMPFDQITVPYERERAMKQYEQNIKAVNSGEFTDTDIERYEGVGIRGDGTEIVVEASVKLFQYESKPAFSAIVRDITGRKQAEEALEMRNRELAASNKITQALNRSMKLEDVLQIALDSVLEFMGLSVGVIYLIDDNKQIFSLVVSRGVGGELAKFIREASILPLNMTFSGKIIKADKDRLVMTNNLLEQIKQPYRSIIERDGLRFAVGIPLKAKGNNIGVICMADSSRRDISAQEIQLLETLGDHIGVAVDNAQLFEKVSEQSVTDELTGLHNRRHFYSVLDGEIYRTERYGHSFSLVIIDLDGFKGYNDRLGHTNGDSVLKSFAHTLKSELRKADIAFRYGGDEFTIILPATRATRAKKIIDRIRSNWMYMSDMAYPVLENPLGFSAGIAQFPEDAETVGDLIFLADAALYYSKRQGGHRSAMVSELETVTADVMSKATLDQVYALATTVDARDPYTYGHSRRVADISELIGKKVGLSENELAILRAASLVHDIGKVVIPDSILAKPGELTKREWELMKKHPGEGARIVGYVNGLADLVPIILHHHERYDGTGYPDGLEGEDIPIAARIISVADAYDTMTTSRPYRRIVSQDEAFEELRRCAGMQFDPELVETLWQVIRWSDRRV